MFLYKQSLKQRIKRQKKTDKCKYENKTPISFSYFKSIFHSLTIDVVANKYIKAYQSKSLFCSIKLKPSSIKMYKAFVFVRIHLLSKCKLSLL
jgi:hypothetical protein